MLIYNSCYTRYSGGVNTFESITRANTEAAARVFQTVRLPLLRGV